MPRRRVGVLGFGKLGQYLVSFILNEASHHNLELAFVWNRTKEGITEHELSTSGAIPPECVLDSVEDMSGKGADLVVEVAHPCIAQQWGAKVLEFADLFVGSPTAFVDRSFENTVREKCAELDRTCYVPAGALWGGQDIQRMADIDTLGGISITMMKEPSSLKVFGEVKERNDRYMQSESEDECVLYDGVLRPLCTQAPNNVNTMACAALAGHTLGFDGVQARLVAKKNLPAHVIEITVTGKSSGDDGQVFRVHTHRYNPAKVGAVTGSATYKSFCSSLTRASGRGAGIQLC